jgi:hypothetical protein
MPIIFSVHPNDGYSIARFVGVITDTEMLDHFKRFFASDDWIPGLNELADIRQADVSQVTSDGVRNLANLIEGIFQQHDISPKVAVYAPHDLPYGWSRMYSVEAERFESYVVFRDFAEAKSRLHDSGDQVD